MNLIGINFKFLFYLFVGSAILFAIAFSVLKDPEQSEARQKLASLLDKAEKDGEVMIKRKDGQIFVVQPKKGLVSPFDVEGIDLDINTEEILEFIREGRRFD